ncbi:MULTISPECIES: hypothetical protein [Xanthomonas]|uniref:hypothetical protein n=1 Tax=Xanthomonas TaxID=338 RepID=UPI001ADCB4DA|nr:MULTISPECIES: hypothetical protein [unclassified Xanthomonas]MBO9872118.1 hypothetical protein [Xanthomonas sp. D-93]WNH42987.1 hypothetical protein PG878_10485 [Xanthomonas sp. A6251]
MILGLEESYEELVNIGYESMPLSPDQVRKDPILSCSASMCDILLEHSLSGLFPEVCGVWGIKADRQATGTIEFEGERVIILLTDALCMHLHQLRTFVSTSSWLTTHPDARGLYEECKAYVSPSQCGELAQMYGLAVTLAHEMGHRIDLSHLSDIAKIDPVARESEGWQGIVTNTARSSITD